MFLNFLKIYIFAKYIYLRQKRPTNKKGSKKLGTKGSKKERKRFGCRNRKDITKCIPYVCKFILLFV